MYIFRKVTGIDTFSLRQGLVIINQIIWLGSAINVQLNPQGLYQKMLILSLEVNQAIMKHRRILHYVITSS